MVRGTVETLLVKTLGRDSGDTIGKEGQWRHYW